jgi:hypothetical protein
MARRWSWERAPSVVGTTVSEELVVGAAASDFRRSLPKEPRARAGDFSAVDMPNINK